MAYVLGYWKCDLCGARGPDGDRPPADWSVARLSSCGNRTNADGPAKIEHVLCKPCAGGDGARDQELHGEGLMATIVISIACSQTELSIEALQRIVAETVQKEQPSRLAIGSIELSMEIQGVQISHSTESSCVRLIVEGKVA